MNYLLGALVALLIALRAYYGLKVRSLNKQVNRLITKQATEELLDAKKKSDKTGANYDAKRAAHKPGTFTRKKPGNS